MSDIACSLTLYVRHRISTQCCNVLINIESVPKVVPVLEYPGMIPFICLHSLVFCLKFEVRLSKSDDNYLTDSDKGNSLNKQVNFVTVNQSHFNCSKPICRLLSPTDEHEVYTNVPLYCSVDRASLHGPHTLLLTSWISGYPHSYCFCSDDLFFSCDRWKISMYNIIYTGQGHIKNPSNLTYIHTFPVLTWNEGMSECVKTVQVNKVIICKVIYKNYNIVSQRRKNHIWTERRGRTKSKG